MRFSCLLDQVWPGKGRCCKLLHLLEVVQTGNLCTSSALKNWNSFNYLHAHIRQAWQKDRKGSRRGKQWAKKSKS